MHETSGSVANIAELISQTSSMYASVDNDYHDKTTQNPAKLNIINKCVPTVSSQELFTPSDGCLSQIS